MNLNDPEIFQRLDPGRVMAGIQAMPDRLEAGWREGLNLHLAHLPSIEGITRVALFGTEPACAAVDLLATYALPLAPVPVLVLEPGPLPGWLQGASTLVICVAAGDSSTAHVLADTALKRDCRVLVHALPEQPMEYIFGLLLATCYRLDLLPGTLAELEDAVRSLRDQQPALMPDNLVARNPAKRMAGQLMGRWVVVFGPGMLEPVARRWKAQINGLAKALAQFEGLPGADLASVAGLNYPEGLLSQVMVLFLQAASLPERSRMRQEFTRQAYMVQGMNTDTIDARGTSRLAHLWTLLQFGDYMAYYLAMAYGENPSQASVLAEMQEELSLFPTFEKQQ